MVWTVFSCCQRRLLPLLPLLLLLLQQQQQQAAAQVLGIDLGSEFIKAAIVAPGKRMELVLSSSSSRKFPNAVSFVEKDTCALTEDAAAQSHKKPDKVYHAASLFLGLAASEIGDISAAEETPEAVAAVAAAAGCSNGSCSSSTGLQRLHPKGGVWPGGLSALYYPWEAYVSPSRGSVLFKVRDNLLLPAESLAAAVLSAVRQAAAAAAHLAPSAALGAVVSVPCRYSQRQRAALRDALEIAGFKVVGLVSHGAAAGVQHALDTYDAATAAGAATSAKDKLLLNVGSSTVDAALVSFQVVSTDKGSSSSSSKGSSSGVPLVSVRGCSSTTVGGGRAVDLLLAESLRGFFEEKNKGVSLSSLPRALKKLEKQAASAKKVLSANKNTFVRVEGLFKGKDLERQLSRDTLEALLSQGPLLKEVETAGAAALAAAAGHTLEETEAIELLGGGWRVPKVLQTIYDWGSEARTKTHLNADEAMATGAAFVAANSTATFRVRKLLLQDGSPFNYSLRFLGLEEDDDEETAVSSDQQQQQQQQQQGKTKVLLAPFKRLSGSKKVSVRTRKDFVVELLEDERVLSTHTISGVQAAHEKRQQDLAKEQQQQEEKQQQQQPVQDDKEAPKAELIFSFDAAGVVDLVKATLIFERTTYTPEKEKETPAAGAAAAAPAAAAGEEKKCESPDSPDCAAAADSSSDSSSNSSSSNKGKRVLQLFPYPLQFSTAYTKPVPLTSEEKKQLKELLLQQEATDLAAKQLSEGLNALETFIYAARSRINEGTLDAVTEESFRQEVLQQLQQDEDWIYGDAAAEGLAAVTQRLSTLKETLNPAYVRAKEAEARPTLISNTDKLLRDFEQRLQQFTDTRPWIPETKISAVHTFRKEMLTWWEDMKQQQEKRSLLLAPLFTEAEVLLKLKDLSKRVKSLEAIPKPTTTTTTTTSPKEGGAAAENETKETKETPEKETEDKEAAPEAAQEKEEEAAEGKKDEL